VFFFSLSTAVLAEGVGLIDSAKNVGITIKCPDGVVNCSENYETKDAQNLILQIVGGLLNFVAVVAVVMLVVASLRLVTSLGNQERLQAAKKQLIWTFAGLAIIIVALLVVSNITEKIYEVAKAEEPVAEEEKKECKTLVLDGLLGPLTIGARGEVPDLALDFVEPLATVCLHTGKSVLEMPLRGSGEPPCLAVEQFQMAYNLLTCDTKTGKRAKKSF